MAILPDDAKVSMKKRKRKKSKAEREAAAEKKRKSEEAKVSCVEASPRSWGLVQQLSTGKKFSLHDVRTGKESVRKRERSAAKAPSTN